MPKKELFLLSKHYKSFLEDIKSKILSARISAARRINKDLIKLYWDIGKAIVERQQKYGWGKHVVERLAKDLQHEFGTEYGFSVQNLWYMRRFYKEYNDSRILQQLVGELPWGHNILIFTKVRSSEAREYYLKSVIKLGWSRNVLLNQIKANAYKIAKKVPKQHNFPKALPAHLAEQADESLKSVYNLDFLGITKPVLERELEKRLIEKVKYFILELGYGFTFIGNQYRLTLRNNEYFVDLLFFNRKLKCLIAIELKTGKFEPEYAGKMDFYLHLLNEQVRLKKENPSIGIILCAEKDNIVVEYALRSAKHPIGVAEYRLTKKLPKKLKKALPTPEQLKKQIAEEL
jgi:predicted nuclease of restriction endonuclease-like (RecB) superfamily